MYTALQIMTVMLAAITMALSLAHALELPGKLRLNREQYLAVQTIYYPGFISLHYGHDTRAAVLRRQRAGKSRGDVKKSPIRQRAVRIHRALSYS
jgi:hypothetical protein